MKMDTIQLSIDNDFVLELIRNLEFHERTKHIGMRHLFVRDEVLARKINTCRVDIRNNLTGIFSEVLPRSQFEKLAEKLVMVRKHCPVKDDDSTRY